METTLHPTTTDTRPHFVYRFFDDKGTLLYTGMTVDPDQRFRAHQRKPWWQFVDSQQIDEVPTRADAFYLEAKAILTGHPKFNKDIPTMERFEVLRSRATVQVEDGAAAEDKLVSLAAENFDLKTKLNVVMERSKRTAEQVWSHHQVALENEELRQEVARLRQSATTANIQMGVDKDTIARLRNLVASPPLPPRTFVVEGPRVNCTANHSAQASAPQRRSLLGALLGR